jgi:mRNA interferase MazF
MELKRGEIVIAVLAGDYGKPRPALVVQSDLFNQTHASILLCPITTDIRDLPLIRATLPPDRGNGLKTVSQVMVDKVTAVSRERIRQKAGRISANRMEEVNRLLRLWLTLEATD